MNEEEITRILYKIMGYCPSEKASESGKAKEIDREALREFFAKELLKTLKLEAEEAFLKRELINSARIHLN